MITDGDIQISILMYAVWENKVHNGDSRKSVGSLRDSFDRLSQQTAQRRSFDGQRSTWSVCK